jgi:RNA polymerase-binding transcription factor DksA
MAKKLDLKAIAARLEKERQNLTLELKKMPEVPELGSDVEGEVFEEEADEAEEYSTNLGIKDVLKQRLADIESALEKILKGAYGKCEKCGLAISDDILEINPEARYCKEHVSHL